jgi:hypothetical protein
MPGRRLVPEQIIGMLRQAGVKLAQGCTVGKVCRGLVCQRAAVGTRDEHSLVVGALSSKVRPT